ncbi:MAG TPA: pyridoxal-dependent decarboxylase, partial [Anaeromyxobacteraceae bacterium]|nr:pyridoxal-dependent decarboxylase [Anaeromyxobacteraceae bacterium]
MPLDLSGQAFQQLADRVTRLARAHLEALDGAPIQPSATGAELLAALGGAAPEEGRGEAVVDLLAKMLPAMRAQNGRFLGYVMGSGEPAGATADLLASVLNQNLTAWRSSPAGVTIERAVVGWLAQALGCGAHAGSLTGGGSMANLMGLAMAREARAPANERGARPGIVYASEQVHMSIGKAVALLGLGRENLRLVPADDAFRMRVDELEQAIARDRAAGHAPLAVVATAGTVATGAVDPLARIADVAEREGLWLHVDGAYGALAAMVA